MTDPYTFAAGEMAELDALWNTAEAAYASNPSGANIFTPLYQKILEFISVDDIQNGTISRAGVDQSVWLWVKGAQGVSNWGQSRISSRMFMLGTSVY